MSMAESKNAYVDMKEDMQHEAAFENCNVVGSSQIKTGVPVTIKMRVMKCLLCCSYGSETDPLHLRYAIHW
ncbi:hypothetical protein M8C21_026069 [Ambrosia artemisiifolia]|uniref:Uncharacterized protein n=1 Tax=Ambrosia artemisiifolia TaxID=4212 RepID=A0AAD5BMS2_AMBAR|nr:hypothetical protein M8C21_026069 [Ambrosia artemisiifolia]